TRIIGRGPETAELDAQWQRAAAGEFRFVLLVGEPGMGKTRLAAEALEDRRRASIELSARAHPLGDTASFGLWVEALERHLRTLSKAEVAQLCGGFLDDLASLLRSVAVVRGAAPEREPPRPRLLEGLAVLLANLAEEAPVVVVLDDVHLADASSWDALHYLAGSLSTERILVVASARPGELADHPVAQRVLLDLEQIGALHRVEIGPLPAEAVRELAEEIIGTAAETELLDWLGSRAQGNPLFVLGLLQALVEEGGDLSRPELRSLPEGLAERVRVRMRRLDDRQREIIDILAVAGGRVELGDVVVLCDRPLEDLGPALQDLVRSRFVAEAREGRTFSYEISHPLIQETVYEGIVGARRVVLHRQVGRVLLTMGRLGEAAPHFARSAEVGDPEALAVLSDALHQAEERGAYGEGLRILGALVELLPAGDRRWVEVAGAFAGRAEWVFDHRADADFAAAIDALRAIDAHLEGSGDLLQRASIKSRLTSFLAWGTGELDQAADTAAQALDLFTRAGDRSGRLLAALEVAYVKGLAGGLPAGGRGRHRGRRERGSRPGRRRARHRALLPGPVRGGGGDVAAQRGRSQGRGQPLPDHLEPDVARLVAGHGGSPRRGAALLRRGQRGQPRLAGRQRPGAGEPRPLAGRRPRRVAALHPGVGHDLAGDEQPPAGHGDADRRPRHRRDRRDRRDPPPRGLRPPGLRRLAVVHGHRPRPPRRRPAGPGRGPPRRRPGGPGPGRRRRAGHGGPGLRSPDPPRPRRGGAGRRRGRG